MIFDFFDAFDDVCSSMFEFDRGNLGWLAYAWYEFGSFATSGIS